MGNQGDNQGEKKSVKRDKMKGSISEKIYQEKHWERNNCCLYAACVLLALRLAVQTQHDMEASLFVGLEICESFFLALCFITDPPDVTPQMLPSYTPPPARSQPSLPKLEESHCLNKHHNCDNAKAFCVCWSGGPSKWFSLTRVLTDMEFSDKSRTLRSTWHNTSSRSLDAPLPSSHCLLASYQCSLYCPQSACVMYW